jgi:hypothetical protein
MSFVYADGGGGPRRRRGVYGPGRGRAPGRYVGRQQRLAESGDAFASSVAAGDLDGHRYGDVTAGAPFEAGANGATYASRAVAMSGAAARVGPLRAMQVDHSAVAEPAAGGAGLLLLLLASGDFNREGDDELAVAVRTHLSEWGLQPRAVSVEGVA